MALLFLAHSFFCCPNPPPLLDDFLRGVSFSLKEKKKQRAAASILLLMTGYPLCLSLLCLIFVSDLERHYYSFKLLLSLQVTSGASVPFRFFLYLKVIL